MTDALANSSSCDFWGKVQSINRQPGTHSPVSVVDDIFGRDNISNLWSEKIQFFLNSSDATCCDGLL